MTLEDFISRFNSTELYDALDFQGLPNIGTNDDKIIKLAASSSTKHEIVYSLAGLEEYRLREISLDLQVAEAGKLSRKRLTNRVIQIVLGEYNSFGHSLSEIKNLKTLVFLSAAASVTMVIFVATTLLYSSAVAFLSIIALAILISFYFYKNIIAGLKKNDQHSS
jgi:hypothetical protein